MKDAFKDKATQWIIAFCAVCIVISTAIQFIDSAGESPRGGNNQEASLDNEITIHEPSSSTPNGEMRQRKNYQFEQTLGILETFRDTLTGFTLGIHTIKNTSITGKVTYPDGSTDEPTSFLSSLFPIGWETGHVWDFRYENRKFRTTIMKIDRHRSVQISLDEY